MQQNKLKAAIIKYAPLLASSTNSTSGGGGGGGASMPNRPPDVGLEDLGGLNGLQKHLSELLEGLGYDGPSICPSLRALARH